MFDLENSHWRKDAMYLRQECIPVGCVPPAAVAVCGGVFASVHAGIPHPGPGPGHPPWVWAWRYPQPDPSTSPPRCGPGNPPQSDPSTSPPRCGPGDPPARPLNFPPPGCGPGDPPSDQTPQLPLWTWTWRPPPWPDRSTSPLGVGLETPPVDRLLDTRF